MNNITNDDMDNYSNARRDVNTGSHPKRGNNGIFELNRTQLLILSLFLRIPEIFRGIKGVLAKKEALKRDILIYQSPYSKLKQDAAEKKVELKNKIAECETKLEFTINEREQIERDLSNRGFSVGNDETNSNVPKSVKQEPNKQTWKKVLKMIGIWIVLEGFALIIQWASLIEEKSIEEIILRMVAMILVLGFYHYASDESQKSKSVVYPVYTGFNILMVALMMIAPPVLYHYFPTTPETADIASAWSLTGDNNIAASVNQSDTPSLVQLYRKNEWFPAAISLILFLVIYPLKNRLSKNDDAIKQNKAEPEQQKVQKLMQHPLSHLKQLEKELKDELVALRKELKDIDDNPTDLLPIINKIEPIKKECLSIDEMVVTLKSELDTLFSNLDLKLHEYKIEYLDVLKNDEIKSQFVRPEWPDRKDILNHFKNDNYENI